MSGKANTYKEHHDSIILKKRTRAWGPSSLKKVLRFKMQILEKSSTNMEQKALLKISTHWDQNNLR